MKDLDTQAKGKVVVAVVDDARSFATLEGEWDDLYHHSSLATPFQTWAWLYSWWEFYGEDYELRLVIVRNDEGLLVGIIPLMLERRRGPKRLLFISTGATDYLDILVRDGWEAEVSLAGTRALRQVSSWQVADLQMVRPEAAAWRLFERWDGHRTSMWQDGCPVIEVKPWDELVSSLSKNHRSTVRRAVRRAELEGLRPELVRADDARRASYKLAAISQDQWRGNPLTSSRHFTWKFEAHLEAVASRMAAKGLGGISEFRRDGEILISTFMVFGRDFIGTYMIGASQEAHQRYQWSSLYIWDALNICRSRNMGHMDLLQGLEPYKLRWKPTIVSNHRLILSRSLFLWSLYSGYLVLRHKVKWHSRSEHAPQWARNAADKYRALRNRLALYRTRLSRRL